MDSALSWEISQSGGFAGTVEIAFRESVSDYPTSLESVLRPAAMEKTIAERTGFAPWVSVPCQVDCRTEHLVPLRLTVLEGSVRLCSRPLAVEPSALVFARASRIVRAMRPVHRSRRVLHADRNHRVRLANAIFKHGVARVKWTGTALEA